MPAFSYKERFVPFVKDGSKRQTVRAFRKYLIKPGQTLYHYFGLRTKFCKKIRPDTVCKDVKTIIITEQGLIYLCEAIIHKADAIVDMNLLNKGEKPLLNNWYKLSAVDKDQFAYNDGFRDDVNETPFSSFQLMKLFWEGTHQLPFTGQVIYW